MFNVIAIILAAASLGSIMQDRPDWREVDQDNDFHAALDMSSISGPLTARTARSVGVFTDPVGSSGYMIIDVVIDCVALTVSGQGGAFFGMDGTLIEQIDGPLETAPISEEDGTLVLARAVCDGEPPTSRSFESAQAYALSVRNASGS